MKGHAGINISVSGGDTTRGIIGVGEGLFSLGSASRMLYAEEMDRYPQLQIHRIGGSAVVMIAHRDLAIDTIRAEDLARLYDGFQDNIGTISGLEGIRAAVQRSDVSGTEEIFSQWLFGPAVRNLDAALNVSDSSASGNSNALTSEGNQ
jgi:ABC-type phosphate transport system substrate-binding protein